MTRCCWFLLAALSASQSATCRGAGQFEWLTATPESQGVSSARLDAIKERLASKKTRAFLVIRNDRIIYEWYAPGIALATKQGTASLAKALVGGMSLAATITDGLISIDDPVAKFVPQWRNDPRKSHITVRQLGSHTSGLSDSTTDNVKNEEQPGWMGDFWKRLDPPRDPFTIARDQTPMLYAPGEKIQYSNPGIGMMTWCVTAAIRDGAHKDVRNLLRERVLLPIGVPDAEWSAGYGRTFNVDGLPLVASWGGAAFTPRATARIGRLVLREGDWEGQRILSKEAVRQVTGDAGLPGNCGMGWWGNGGLRYGKLPKDAVWGAGAGDQLLLVVPGLNLIMVRNGATLAPGPGEPPPRDDDVFTKYHDYRARILFEPLIEAVTNSSRGSPSAETATGPLPPSPVIKGIRWEPVASIRRAAIGSDNWPLTWADDDALYIAYGDGNGFEPFIREKLGMGFAKVTGGPSDFKGMNIRSPTGENYGHGAKGLKASGLLCLDGILYLFARNATNSQLAWSTDHGSVWTWADWRFTESFGSPSFLDFGKNYGRARDKFVYIYSPDSGSAYIAADQVVLARVPKARLRDHDSYEFFAGLDESSQPSWTRDIGGRKGVLTYPGHAYRTRVTYVAALKRYLMVQPVPSNLSRDHAGKLDTRFAGGMAVFDAPEPWGPWTTVFFTDQWDVGPGDSASFPSKWASADGRALHLVFSGDDSFSVRRADLLLGRRDGRQNLARDFSPMARRNRGMIPWRSLTKGATTPAAKSTAKNVVYPAARAVIIENTFVKP